MFCGFYHQKNAGNVALQNPPHSSRKEAFTCVKVSMISMDIQMKRGLLDVCVLAAIKDEPSYGYKIIKDISAFVEISESTLYPILRRLESASLLTVQSAEYNGRLRKYYQMTPSGVLRIEEFKEEWKELLKIYQFVTKETVTDD